MPIVDNKYVSPVWRNNAPPSLNADELNAISNSVERDNGHWDEPEKYVGDILLTSRTDLGDKYILCNGDYIVNRSEYPDLWDVLQYCTPDNTLWFSKSSIGSTNTDSTNDDDHVIACGNGHIVSISNSQTSSPATYLTDVQYSSDNGISWSYKCLSNSSSHRSSIIFDGNKFVYAYSQDSQIIIRYNSVPTEALSGTAIISMVGTVVRLNVTFDGGIYFIYAESTKDGNVSRGLYASSDVSGSFVKTNLYMSQIGNVKYVTKYINGNFVHILPSISDDKLSVFISTSSNGMDWSLKTLSNVISAKCAVAFFANGEFYVWAQYSTYDYIIKIENVFSNPTATTTQTNGSINGLSGIPNSLPSAYGNFIIGINGGKLCFVDINKIEVFNTTQISMFFPSYLAHSDTEVFVRSKKFAEFGTVPLQFAKCPYNEKVIPLVDGTNSYPMIKSIK